MFDADAYNTSARLYESPVFRPLQVVLMFLVIFHAFNGLRVITVDLWPRGARYQAQLGTAVWVVTLGLFLPSAWIMLRPLFG